MQLSCISKLMLCNKLIQKTKISNMNKLQYTLFSLLFLAACSSPAAPEASPSVFARHIEIQGGENTYDFAWPFVSIEIESPNLEKALTLESIAQTTEEEIRQSLADTQRGYTGSTFNVNFDKNQLLSLTVWMEFTGAYLDQIPKDINFDLSTDQPLRAEDLYVSEEKAEELAEILDEQLQSALEEGSPEMHFNLSDLDNFTLQEEGIEWPFEGEASHVNAAANPQEPLRLTYEELEEFLQADIKERLTN